jgi:hypothetical protein
MPAMPAIDDAAGWLPLFNGVDLCRAISAAAAGDSAAVRFASRGAMTGRAGGLPAVSALVWRGRLGTRGGRICLGRRHEQVQLVGRRGLASRRRQFPQQQIHVAFHILATLRLPAQQRQQLHEQLLQHHGIIGKCARIDRQNECGEPQRLETGVHRRILKHCRESIIATRRRFGNRRNQKKKPVARTGFGEC